MRLTYAYKIVIALLLEWLLATGYAAPAEHIGGFWVNMTMNGALKTKKQWLYFLQIENRFRDRDPLQRATLIRPAIGYAVTKRTSLWVGYTAEPTYSSSRRWSYNSNVFEQLSHQFIKNKKMTLNLRVRQEQRFNNTNSDTAHRSRLRLEVVLPVYRSKWSSVISNECFFNLNHPRWVSSNMFSQNRFYLGFRYQFNQQHKVSFGYLNRTDFDNVTTVVNHIIFLGWALSDV